MITLPGRLSYIPAVSARIHTCPTSTMSGCLHLDIWLAIASHLSVQSILNLSYCCSYLYHAMEARSVWSLVLEDILDVIPSSSVQYDMKLMSSRELRKKAIRMANVDAMFNSDVIKPARIQRFAMKNGEALAEVFPGGDWVATIHEDETMRLHRTKEFNQTALVIVKRPDESYRQTSTLSYDSLYLAYSEGKHIAVVSEPFCIGGSHEFRVYHIDLMEPSMRLLTKFTRPERYCHFAFSGGLLATGWVEGDNYFLGIKKISFSNTDEEVILDLGQNAIQEFSLMTILCDHMILLSSSQGLYLYRIPELVPTPQNCACPILRATPIATYDENLSDNSSGSSGSIWNSLCSHHVGRQSTLAFSDDYKCRLVILPSSGQDSNHFAKHNFDTFISHGPSRAVWLGECLDNAGNTVLGGSVHSTKPDNYLGYARLERSRAPDPLHALRIPLGMQIEEIEDMSWDEESGRIGIVCLLDESRSLLLVDLV